MLDVSVRVPILLGVADRDHQDVHVEVEVGSDVGVEDVDTDDPMDRDGVDEEDEDRVRGSVMDPVEDEDALLDRNDPCVCVDDEEEDHDSREERVGVRVEVIDRLAVDDGDRVRVWIADADEVAERVFVVVPRSVRVLIGVLETVLVPNGEVEDVDDELALRVPSIVLEDVDDDDVLLDAPIVREVVDDAVEFRDRMELPVVVTDVHIVCVIRADAVDVRVGRAVHVWSAVDVEVKDPTDLGDWIRVGKAVRVPVAVFVDVSVNHDVRVPVPVRVDVLEAVVESVGRIPTGVPSAKMLRRNPNRSILAYQAFRQKVFKHDVV